MRTKKPDSNERDTRKRFRMVKPPWTGSKGSFYTYRLPNKTPGFNVFARGWVLRSAGLRGFGRGGSDARATNLPDVYAFQSRSGVTWTTGRSSRPHQAFYECRVMRPQHSVGGHKPTSRYLFP